MIKKEDDDVLSRFADTSNLPARRELTTTCRESRINRPRVASSLFISMLRRQTRMTHGTSHCRVLNHWITEIRSADRCGLN